MTWAWSGELGMDLHEALRAACQRTTVTSYLEIGVDGGGSLNTVLCEVIPARIVLCDIWNHEYCGHGDTKVIVQDILEWHGATAEFLDGDSKETVPALRGLFDLVLVDGDHSAAGALVDLQNAWPRVRPGGILVMDDINHPNYPWLSAVWEACVKEWNMWVIPETRGGCNAAIALK